ncbi:MAG: hypothetical protein K2G12_08150, partial [Prevotella sp.]|nr:hypothetical protein [Prevotella sp.]
FISLLLVSSCNEDHEMPIDDNKSQETLRLRDLYATKVQGSWHHVFETEKVYLGQTYTFEADGSVKGHVLLKQRHRVMVNGESVLTDWETIDDEDFTGTWDLRYMSSVQKNVLYITSSGYAVNAVIDFIGVDDNILEIKSPLLINDIIKMSRIDTQP